MVFTIVLFFLVCCAYFWRRHVMLRRRIKDLPPIYPGVWPILGHCPLLISYGDVSHVWNLIKKGSKIITNNGGVMTTLIGELVYFVMTDPNDCATIANECPDKDFIYYFLRPWLGRGLITGSGEVWKRHRKLLNPAFSQQVLNSFIEIFNDQSRQLVKDMEVNVGNAPFSLVQHLENTTLETIYQTAIGINSEEYNIQNKEAYLNTVKEMWNIIITRTQKFWLQNQLIYKWSSHKTRQDNSVKIMKDMYIEVMNAKKLAEKTNESERELKYKAFMDLLFEYSADGSLSNKEVWDEVNTILVAGHDTSATTLVYTLVLIGSHPVIQDKVYEELIEVFDNSYRDVDKIDLTKLVYLEAVIKESLRLYPIVPAIIRRIKRDVKLTNYTLPAGSGCVFSIHGLNTHPVWGADADRFRPERWLEPSAPPRNAFACFGLGKRYCIGKTYSMMFMKTVLAHMLRRYRITGDVSKLKIKMDTLLKPHSGYLISIDKRNMQKSEITYPIQTPLPTAS